MKPVPEHLLTEENGFVCECGCGKLITGRRRRYLTFAHQKRASLPKTRFKKMTQKQIADKKKAGRRAYLKSKYGITPTEYDAMHLSQRGKCACCGTSKVTALDHDHQTGKVRELLCNNCNCMLGFAKEDVNRLQAGIRYLQKHLGTMLPAAE
jgi:hypothetical protein